MAKIIHLAIRYFILTYLDQIVQSPVNTDVCVSRYVWINTMIRTRHTVSRVSRPAGVTHCNMNNDDADRLLLTRQWKYEFVNEIRIEVLEVELC